MTGNKEVVDRIAAGRSDFVFELVAAGAKVDARDAHGDPPLSRASWHVRPPPVPRLLYCGAFRIRPDYGEGLAADLRGYAVV